MLLRLGVMAERACPFCKFLAARSKLARFLAARFRIRLLRLLTLEALKSLLLLLLKGLRVLLRGHSVRMHESAGRSSPTGRTEFARNLIFWLLEILRLYLWHLTLLERLLLRLLLSGCAKGAEASVHF